MRILFVICQTFLLLHSLVWLLFCFLDFILRIWGQQCQNPRPSNLSPKCQIRCFSSQNTFAGCCHRNSTHSTTNVFFSQAACSAWRSRRQNCRSSCRREEFYPEKELQGQSGAVNHCSARVSEQLWTCTTERKNPRMTPIQALTPTPVHRSWEDWGQSAERPQTRNPQKKSEGTTAPPSLRSSYKSEHYNWNDMFSSPHAKERQLHPVRKHGACNRATTTLNPVQLMRIHARKSLFPSVHPSVLPFTILVESHLRVFGLSPGWMFKTLIASQASVADVHETLTRQKPHFTHIFYPFVCRNETIGRSFLLTIQSSSLLTSPPLLSMRRASRTTVSPPTTNSHLSLGNNLPFKV